MPTHVCCRFMGRPVLIAWMALLMSCGAEGRHRIRQNGIRLVAASGTSGRLEISSTDFWILDVNETVAWRPVCDEGGLVDDSMVQVMCQLLGYKYGRRYYSPRVTYRRRRQNNTLSWIRYPVGSIRCIPNPAVDHLKENSGRTRLLGEAAVGAAASASASGATILSSPGRRQILRDGHQEQHNGVNGGRALRPLEDSAESMGLDGVSSSASARSSSSSGSSGSSGSGSGLWKRRWARTSRTLLAPLTGAVDMPSDAPYTCEFELGRCEYEGPLVGIECFEHGLPPTPPSPPPRPNSPPAPPPGSKSIIMYGGGYNPRDPEPNLCPSTSFCRMYGRVELEVDAPGGGGKVWAPLCASQDEALTYKVSQMVCWQTFDWPRFAVRPEFTVYGEQADMPFSLPEGPVTTEGHFNPANYIAWASVGGGNFDRALRVQDLDLQVSSRPCEYGLFALYCVVME